MTAPNIVFLWGIKMLNRIILTIYDLPVPCLDFEVKCSFNPNLLEG